jgi:hypothetical protein
MVEHRSAGPPRCHASAGAPALVEQGYNMTLGGEARRTGQARDAGADDRDGLAGGQFGFFVRDDDAGSIRCDAHGRTLAQALRLSKQQPCNLAFMSWRPDGRPCR